MALYKFKYKNHNPSAAEKQRRGFVQDRLMSMNTKYRKSLIAMAKLGLEATDGIATEEDRVNNSELMKVPISHAVIMQRLSTLADNPSKAIYRTESNDKNRLNIAEQLNKHDKIEGCYDASYLDFMQQTEKKGVCFVKQGWHEKIKEIDGKPVTVGKMFTSQEEVKIENFWWDARANQLRGYKGVVANDVIEREYDTILNLRMRFGYDENYKNINMVKPMGEDTSFYGENVWQEMNDEKEEVEDENGEVDRTASMKKGVEVTLWHYYARNFYDTATGEISDRYLVFANGVEIRNSEIPTPKVKGDAVLPFLKFVALPTGGMGGISMPALIRHPEKALQRMITMADAQAELAVNPIQFVSSSISEALDDAQLMPGSRVEVDLQGRSVADELYFHQAPDITNGATYIIDKMLTLITMITGVDISVLFESPRTKAISTERKREIQEKLLRYSVIYNEQHGFFDLEEMRLHIMLENYPVKRYFLDKDDKGEEEVNERYPDIPINGYQVKLVEGFENKPDDEKKYELKKSSKTFNMLVINPASIEYNIHLYIEGATQAGNEDTFKLNKAIEKLNLLSTNPWTTQVIDPIKGSRKVFEMLNVDEDDFIREELETTSDNLHGATKEIQALLMTGVKDIQIILDEDYDAEEYVDLFANFMQLEEFNKLDIKVREAIMSRYGFHLENSLNPYYKRELQQRNMEQQQAMAQAANPTAVRSAREAKVAPSNPNEMTENVNSKAGALGKAGKTTNQLANEQTSNA